MHLKTVSFLFVIIILLFTACQGEDVARPAEVALRPSPVVEPTPTLAPGLPTPTVTSAEAAVFIQSDIPTVTPFPSPTPVPDVTERLAIGQRDVHNGDYDNAIANLESVLAEPGLFSPPELDEARYLLGVSLYENGRYTEAITTFNDVLTQTDPPDPTHYYLAKAYRDSGDFNAAINHYQSYLAANPDMTTYVQVAIAEAYLALGDAANAQAAYEAALAGDAHYLTLINIRRQLADTYLNAGDADAAIAQYDAMRDLAFTERTKGEMTYLAGSAALAAGQTDAGYAYFQEGVTKYPQAYESYLGLVELVEAGVPVDDFQRGLVDFYAEAYDPAIVAFQSYLDNNPETARAEAYLYLAWSYEALGDLTSALAQLDLYTAVNPADATIERGKMLARSGDAEGAVAQYQSYLADYPDGESAPFAAWWSAALAAETATAIERYQEMADNYSWHEDAPEALFQAGLLANDTGDVETAVSLWQQAVQNYPNATYGGASAVWLLRVLDESPDLVLEDDTTAVDLQTAVTQRVNSSNAVSYYPLRARDIVNENPPFAADIPFALPDAATQEALQLQAEAWLRSWLGLEAGTDVRTLSPAIANDPRLLRGQKLWLADEYELGRYELDSVRESYKDDALASYQLALFFRDLGVYRSSILAATRLFVLSEQSVFAAPKFIGQLAYPTYYADLLLPLASQYSYDPRIQFALLRQESLFESFARSGAAAQGLSQVIPDTGAFIAQRLNWPDYENEDLYKPYVGLHFGSYYLNGQLDGFDQSVHAALSAYNAGPGNAARWYEAHGDDLDAYVEFVDFAETRLYIERIYEGFVIYRFLYGT